MPPLPTFLRQEESSFTHLKGHVRYVTEYETFLHPVWISLDKLQGEQVHLGPSEIPPHPWSHQGNH